MEIVVQYYETHDLEEQCLQGKRHRKKSMPHGWENITVTRSLARERFTYCHVLARRKVNNFSGLWGKG